jgi:hypothetical protein
MCRIPSDLRPWHDPILDASAARRVIPPQRLEQNGGVNESTGNGPLIDLDEGYRAAYCFIRQFYERDGLKPESMFHLLSWIRLDGPRKSSDPAQWNDWVHSVSIAMERGTEVFADPVSPPLFKSE